MQSKALSGTGRSSGVAIKGGVGVVAHQSQCNPMYGTLGLELLDSNSRMWQQQALDLIPGSDEGPRDAASVRFSSAAAGRTAAWTGSEALDWKGRNTVRA